MSFRRQRRKGNAMLEFGMAASVLIPVMAGTFQFGYSLYVYNRLESAVNNGIRYAAGRTYRTLNGSTDVTKGQTAIKNMVVFGSPSGGSVPVVRGLTTANVSASYTLTSGLPTSVAVSIVNFPINSIFKTYTLTNKPTRRFPYYGRYAPEESEP